MLTELGCDDKPTLLVLNKIDQVTDRSHLHVLMRHHPKAVTVSAATGQGLDDLRGRGDRGLRADFADAEVTTGIGATAGCWRTWPPMPRSTARTYEGDTVVLRCYIPKHLLHHIEGPDVAVRLLPNGEGN